MNIQSYIVNKLKAVFHNITVDYEDTYKICTPYIQGFEYSRSPDLKTASVNFILATVCTNQCFLAGELFNRVQVAISSGVIKGFTIKGSEKEVATIYGFTRTLNMSFVGDIPLGEEFKGSEEIKKININQEEVDK